MKKLSHKEYFELYDKKLQDAYFSDAQLLPDDSVIKCRFLELRKTLHRLNKESDRFFRYTIRSGIDRTLEDHPDLIKYIDGNGKDCLLYCLDNDLPHAVYATALNLPQEKVDLALMFYASDSYGSFGFYSDKIPHSSPVSAFLINQGKADPQAVIETEMPCINDKEKKEIVQNTPLMYFLEKNSDKKNKPFIPSPDRFPEFYEGCPFTLKNPQGETLFSLLIKRRLYTVADELLTLMSETLSPEEMNKAINMPRVDAHFRKIERQYGLASERSLFVEGNTRKAGNIGDNREKMRDFKEKIHNVYKKNQEAIAENKKAEKKALKQSQTQKSQETVTKKVVELYQPNLFDF